MKNLLALLSDGQTIVIDEYSSPHTVPEYWTSTPTGLLLAWPDRVRVYPWSSIKYIEYPP